METKMLAQIVGKLLEVVQESTSGSPQEKIDQGASALSSAFVTFCFRNNLSVERTAEMLREAAEAIESKFCTTEKPS